MLSSTSSAIRGAAVPAPTRATARSHSVTQARRGLVVPCAAVARKERLLPLLSELVETQARTASFETLAGRTAMIGFAVAALSEAALPGGGLFGGFQDAQGVSLLGAALVASSAGLALTLPRRLSRRLLEPVLASLTSKARSNGSVSGRDVDSALDTTVDSIFTSKFLNLAFPMEVDDPLI